MTLTLTDLFCGAGGSSTGAVAVPGVTVRIASNHWDLAVETHNINHPDADHLCADISAVDPRRFPRTDLLWASPECTNHSVAKGRKRAAAQPDLFGEVLIAELRGGGSKHRPVTDPLCTVVANGNHHALVTSYYGNGGTHPAAEALTTVTAVERHALLMRNNTARGDQGQMTTPITEPARTITTTGHQSLLAAERPTIDVDDVLFRMLEPREIKGAMDFPPTYRILGNRREQTRQAGNAVTPPSARDHVGVVAESLGVTA